MAEKFVEVAKALVDSTFSCLSGPTPPLLSPLPPAVSLRGCVMAWTWLSPYPRSCEPPAVSYAGVVARALVGSESESRPPGQGGGSPRELDLTMLGLAQTRTSRVGTRVRNSLTSLAQAGSCWRVCSLAASPLLTPISSSLSPRSSRPPHNLLDDPHTPWLSRPRAVDVRGELSSCTTSSTLRLDNINSLYTITHIQMGV